MNKGEDGRFHDRLNADPRFLHGREARGLDRRLAACLRTKELSHHRQRDLLR